MDPPPGEIFKDPIEVQNLSYISGVVEVNLGFTKNVSNIHTHGWHVSPKEPSDAAHLHLMPGEIYNYSYDLSLQEAGTLNFYHPHIHGLTADSSQILSIKGGDPGRCSTAI